MPGVELTPEVIASCPECGCLVIARAIAAGGDRWLTLVWDPSWGERRVIRSWLSREDIERQGFGLIVAGNHECPPEWDCALQPQPRERRRCSS